MKYVCLSNGISFYVDHKRKTYHARGGPLLPLLVNRCSIGVAIDKMDATRLSFSLPMEFLT